MMVEAEATETTWRARSRARTSAPRPRRSWPQGLEAAKPFIAQLLRRAVRPGRPRGQAGQGVPDLPGLRRTTRTPPSRAASGDLGDALRIADKQEREGRIDEIKAARRRPSSAAQFEGREKELSAAYRSVQKKLIRQRILRDKVRIDGRGLGDIRQLSAEVEVIPRVHGSALFERGETQILGVTTLNMLRMEQQLDTLSPETRKRYMHNYNFPPFSTGETGRVGSPKRREIGHGALAERALMPVLPSREEFPYAIRQVSEALSSNGSTSMGSVCASTLSLLNAGVPLQGAGRRHRDGPRVATRWTVRPATRR